MFQEKATWSEAILFVDDEDMILDVGKQMMEKLGYRVYAAKNGKEAIEAYQAKKDDIDMVILDMVMPDMGGKKTYEALKNIDPNVLVLLSSGHVIDGGAMEIKNCGCDGFLQKPFNMKQLSMKIREVLDKEESCTPQ
jgi:DNA-binding NtrC family response regulator